MVAQLDYQSCKERQPGLETFKPALKSEGMIFPWTIVCSTMASTSWGVTRPYQIDCPAGVQIYIKNKGYRWLDAWRNLNW